MWRQRWRRHGFVEIAKCKRNKKEKKKKVRNGVLEKSKNGREITYHENGRVAAVGYKSGVGS